MSFGRINIDQLLGVDVCPHCAVAAPLLQRVWYSEHPVSRSDQGKTSRWAAFRCTSCGSIVTAKAAPNSDQNGPAVAIFPPPKVFDIAVPERARRYLTQAHKTLASPDASVVMSAAAVDAMLKHFGLKEGSLYARIDKGVKDGLLTKVMSEWAHQVRIDSNNPRHADETTPHLNQDEALRAFDFAEAFAEYLFVLPAKMPPNTPPAPALS